MIFLVCRDLIVDFVYPSFKYMSFNKLSLVGDKLSFSGRFQ